MSNKRSIWYNKVKKIREQYLSLYTKKEQPNITVSWKSSTEEFMDQYSDLMELYDDRIGELKRIKEQKAKRRNEARKLTYYMKNKERIDRVNKIRAEKEETKKKIRQDKLRIRQEKQQIRKINKEKAKEEKAVHRILVNNRTVNDSVGVIIQRTTFNTNISNSMVVGNFSDNKKDMFALKEVAYLNTPDIESLEDDNTINHFDNTYMGLVNELNKASDILLKMSDLKFVGLHLKVAALQYHDVELAKKTVGILIRYVTINCDRAFSNYIKSRDNEGFRVHLFELIKEKFTSGESCIAVVEYRVLSSMKNNFDNFTKYVRELKAYQPMSNQEFHEATACSTTKDRLCIYQTYCYLYINTSSIKKGMCEDLFSKESDEIRNIVKSGDLYNFCRLKSVQHNEVFNIEFFKPIIRDDIIIYGFTMAGDKVKQIEDILFFEGKKTFLYDCGHVAPRRLLKLKTKKPVNKLVTKSSFKLKPSKPSKCEIDYVSSYDFETLPIDEEGTQKPYCCCVKSPKGNKHFYGLIVVKELCDYIDTIKTETYVSKTNPKKKVKQILVYGFNNSRFDNIFIFNELHNRNPATKYIIHNGYKYIKYYNVRFYDLNLYYTMSLKATAQAFKLNVDKDIYPYEFVREFGKDVLNYVGEVPEAKYWPNGKSDYDQYVKENGNVFNMKEYTIKYCMRDSELTLQIANKHLEQCVGKISVDGKEKEFDVRMCPTGASISLKLFSQVFLEKTLYNSDDKQQLKEQKAYKGGRTECFKKEFITDGTSRMVYIDINSSYPAAMTKVMPVKYIKTIFMDPTVDNEFVDHWLYCARAKYIGNKDIVICNLLVKDDKGTIIEYPDGEFTYHWGCELNEAVKNDFEVIINEVNEYTGEKLFEEFATYMYNERLVQKRLNPAKAEFYKLCMNSLYGKFGQKQMINNKICTRPEDINNIFSNINSKVVDWEILSTNKILVKYKKLGDEYGIGSLVRFSSCISAYARCNLSLMMRAIGWENVYNCDTDSIFTTATPPNELLSQTELGKWKLECQKGSDKPLMITEAHFLAPKLYNYKTEDGYLCMKAKGQPSSQLKEEFYTELASGKKSQIAILNKSMFVRSLNDVKIHPQVRSMQEVYNKRKWVGNDSYAFNTFAEWKINKKIIDMERIKKKSSTEDNTPIMEIKVV